MNKRSDRAIIYVRVSRGEGETLQRQEADCRDLCRMKGLDVIEVLTEPATSAWSGVERPRFEQAIEMLRSDKADYLVIWKLDRLARVLSDWHRIVASGKEIISVNDSLDTKSVMGRFTSDIIMRVHQLESEQTSMRTRAAKKDAAYKGRKPDGGGRAFAMSEDWTCLVDEEAEALREIAQRLIAGASLMSCVRWLNEDLQMPTGGGLEWSPQSLRAVLLSPRMVGDRTHLGEVVAPNSFPAALDRPTWELVGMVLNDPARFAGPGGEISLLSGIITCGKCRGRLRKLDKGTRARYACRNPKCMGVTILMAPLDEYVISMAPGFAGTIGPGRRSQMEADLVELHGRRKALMAMFVANDIDQDEWAIARRELSSKIVTLERTLSRAPNYSTTRGFVHAAVREVIVMPVGKGKRGVSPEDRTLLVGRLTTDDQRDQQLAEWVKHGGPPPYEDVEPDDSSYCRKSASSSL